LGTGTALLLSATKRVDGVEKSRHPPIARSGSSDHEKRQLPSLKRKRKYIMGQRLYVGNLSFNTAAESLRAAFAAIDEVTDVHVVEDRETGRSRGFAFVTMASAAGAQKAIEAMNGAVVEGRPLRVNEAEERQPRGGGGGGGNGGRRNGGERRGGHRGW
jgi:cold-inducible RNA-binding protein